MKRYGKIPEEENRYPLSEIDREGRGKLLFPELAERDELFPRHMALHLFSELEGISEEFKDRIAEEHAYIDERMKMFRIYHPWYPPNELDEFLEEEEFRIEP